MRDRRSIFGMGAMAAALAAPAPSQANWNPQHEVQVYSVVNGYGELTDSATGESVAWKTESSTNDAQDPYDDFWENLDCDGWECKYSGGQTRRRRNSRVTVNNMAGSRGWDTADMVVFHGHIAQIRPLWSLPAVGASEAAFWHPDGNGGWTKVDGEFADWGTSSEPFRYYRISITDASSSNPFIVFYAHNPLTSILVGSDFVNEMWYTVNYWNQPFSDRRAAHRLGDLDLEWIVGNGCTAVPVATPEGDGVVSTPVGTRAWRKSWSKLHQVVGHYYLSVGTRLPDLGAFAVDLMAGDQIRQAYFDLHTYADPDHPAFDQPGSIAATPDGCCAWRDGDSIVCLPDLCYTELMNETWNSPRSDPRPTADDSPPLVTSWKVAY